MGGIQCVTPHNAIEKAEEIIRDVKETPSSKIVEFGKIELQDYSKNKGEGLDKLVVLEVNASNENCSKMVRLGGFHLLMSYLGAIGHIMAGSCPGPVGLLPSCPGRLASNLKLSNQIDRFRENMEELERRGQLQSCGYNFFE